MRASWVSSLVGRHRVAPSDRTLTGDDPRRRYIASSCGGGLYPRAPFNTAARRAAADIDSWLDFSAGAVAGTFAGAVERAQSQKVRPGPVPWPYSLGPCPYPIP